MPWALPSGQGLASCPDFECLRDSINIQSLVIWQGLAQGMKVYAIMYIDIQGMFTHLRYVNANAEHILD